MLSVSLDGNSLTGTIPPVFFTGVVFVSLSSNYFEGTLPPQINTVSIDVSHNKLTGQLPNVGESDYSRN